MMLINKKIINYMQCGYLISFLPQQSLSENEKETAWSGILFTGSSQNEITARENEGYGQIVYKKLARVYVYKMGNSALPFISHYQMITILVPPSTHNSHHF